jgi:hypothetical protein
LIRDEFADGARDPGQAGFGRSRRPIASPTPSQILEYGARRLFDVQFLGSHNRSIHVKDETNVVWFLLRFCAKIDYC